MQELSEVSSAVTPQWPLAGQVRAPLVAKPGWPPVLEELAQITLNHTFVAAMEKSAAPVAPTLQPESTVPA